MRFPAAADGIQSYDETMGKKDLCRLYSFLVVAVSVSGNRSGLDLDGDEETRARRSCVSELRSEYCTTITRI